MTVENNTDSPFTNTQTHSVWLEVVDKVDQQPHYFIGWWLAARACK